MTVDAGGDWFPGGTLGDGQRPTSQGDPIWGTPAPIDPARAPAPPVVWPPPPPAPPVPIWGSTARPINAGPDRWHSPGGPFPHWRPVGWNPPWAGTSRPAPPYLHKFYLRRNGLGCFYLMLGVGGWATSWLLVGLLLLVPLWLMLLVDLLSLPGQVRRAYTGR